MPSKSDNPANRAADTIASDCLAVRVRLLNRTITAIFDNALRPLGLTAGQLNILVIITKRGPISAIEIAERLNMEKSTVSRNLGRMRDNGWLKVSAAEPGQKQRLALSRRGKELLAKSLPAWKRAQTQATQVLGQRGGESLAQLDGSGLGLGEDAF